MFAIVHRPRKKALPRRTSRKASVGDTDTIMDVGGTGSHRTRGPSTTTAAGRPTTRLLTDARLDRSTAIKGFGKNRTITCVGRAARTEAARTLHPSLAEQRLHRAIVVVCRRLVAGREATMAAILIHRPNPAAPQADQITISRHSAAGRESITAATLTLHPSPVAPHASRLS